MSMNDDLDWEPFDPAAFLAMVRRRKNLILVIGSALLLLAVAIILFSPRIYRSSATILIEAPDVPDELVPSTISSLGDERLRIIEQRVMTTQNLISLIDKYDLYPGLRQTTEASVLAERLRKRVSLDLVKAETTDAKNGYRLALTIAFTVSYDGRSPEIAQRVTNEIVTFYLSDNLQLRQRQATGTAGFLSGESQRLADHIAKLETRLANFKIQNQGSLPEEFQFNTMMLDRAESQLLEVVRQERSLGERHANLQAQLAMTDPYAGTIAGQANLSRSALQAQYLALRARFGERHLDVLAVKRQIEALGGAVPQVEDVAALMARRDEAERALAEARQKFGPEHPDIKVLTKEATDATAALAAARSAKPAVVAPPDNPVYIQTQIQLNAVNNDLAMTKTQGENLRKKIADLEERLARTPEVERSYVAIKREYDDAVVTYQGLREKEGDADLAKNLEVDRKGERYVVVEPPNLPLDPVWPNKLLILAAGLVMGLGAGVGCGMVADSLSGKVYGHRQLARIAGAAPLVIVPYVRTGARGRAKSFLKRFQPLFGRKADVAAGESG